MDKKTAQKVNAEVKAAIDEILNKYGFTVDRASMRYSDYTVSFNITTTLKRNDGSNIKVVSPSMRRGARSLLIDYDPRWADVPEADIFGKGQFVNDLGYCKIIDFNPRRRKYPFTVVALNNNQQYRVTASSIMFQ